MVSALDSVSSGLGSNVGRGHVNVLCSWERHAPRHAPTHPPRQMKTLSFSFYCQKHLSIFMFTLSLELYAPAMGGVLFLCFLFLL